MVALMIILTRLGLGLVFCSVVLMKLLVGFGLGIEVGLS